MFFCEFSEIFKNTKFVQHVQRATFALLQYGITIMQYIYSSSLKRFVGNKVIGRTSKWDNTYPVCVSGGRRCSFLEKFGGHCFLETAVLKFAFSPYYQGIKNFTRNNFSGDFKNRYSRSWTYTGHSSCKIPFFSSS